MQGTFSFKTRIGFSRSPLHVVGTLHNGELSLTLNGKTRSHLIDFGAERGPIEKTQLCLGDWVEEAPLIGRVKQTWARRSLAGPFPE